MKNSIQCTIAFLLALIMASSHAQISIPQPSPIGTITQEVGLTDISIAYSRPSMKGRKIFGELAPYNEVWRTGANASTKIKFSDEVMVEGNKIPAGEYALYTIPGKEEWTIILNKNTSLWGSDGYEQEDDAARFTVKPVTTPAPTETFTITIGALAMDAAQVGILWENTLVKFKIETEVDSKVMAQIERAMANPQASLANLYFQSAAYYYETDKDLAQALDWINKAVEINDAFYVIHLKAKIQGKMKDYKNAIATAERSMAKAKEAKNMDYVRLNEKLIAGWKARN